MDRDLYRLLRLENDCSMADIENARERAKKLISTTPNSGLDQDSALEYIDSVADLLQDSEGRKCYDALVYSHISGNITHHELTRKRIEIYNTQPGVVKIGASMIDAFKPQLQLPDTLRVSLDTICRFCDQKFDHHNESTLLCKCSSRSGHTLCAELFKSEHVRCPVCRQALLMRSGISKYMIYGVDKRYDPLT